jgi:predicted O-methyltransferase YrrM
MSDQKQRLSQLAETIKVYSLQKQIPIIRTKTMAFIIDFIDSHQCKTVLEIGTAYGFSACAMLTCSSIDQIITIEKNKFNFELAQSFLKDIPQITCLNLNAFDYQPLQKFDLILIDGPKSHQEILVEKFSKYLNRNGTLIVDNIFLKKFQELQVLTKNQKSLLHKVKTFQN